MSRPGMAEFPKWLTITDDVRERAKALVRKLGTPVSGHEERDLAILQAIAGGRRKRIDALWWEVVNRKERIIREIPLEGGLPLCPVCGFADLYLVEILTVNPRDPVAGMVTIWPETQDDGLEVPHVGTLDAINNPSKPGVWLKLGCSECEFWGEGAGFLQIVYDDDGRTRCYWSYRTDNEDAINAAT
jgi:hypothetical protein